MATQIELHSFPALVLRLARATKPEDKYSSEWQSHQSRAVSGRGYQFKGFPVAHRTKRIRRGNQEQINLSVGGSVPVAPGMTLKANNPSFPFCSLHHSPISVLIF